MSTATATEALPTFDQLEGTAKNDRSEAFALLRDAAMPDLAVLKTAAAWLLLAALLEAIGPYLGKLLFDNHLVPRNAELATMAALLLGAWLAGSAASVIRYFQLVRLAGLAMRSVQRIRERVYGHVLRLPMRFFDTAITGQLVSRVTNDTEAVKSLYVQVLFVMLDAAITVCGVFVLMFWLNWRLALVGAAMLPAVVIVVMLYQHFSAPAVAKARSLRSDINAQMAENINGMQVLQAANAAPRFADRLRQTSWAHYTARTHEVRANAWLLRPMLDALNVVLLACVIAMFGLQGHGGWMGPIEVGVLYAFIAYVERVVEPMINITVQFSQFQQSVVAASRVNTLLRETEAEQPANALRVASGVIEIENLNFQYAKGPQVLHGVNLRIPHGAFYGVVGHTGSGKSTLLSLLLRFYDAPAGSVRLDGRDIAAFDEDAFRQAVALVPQEPFLLAASAFENIDMGRKLPRDRVEAAAKAAQAHGFILELERGYDTPLGEGGARLSVGQKQLIAIARALAGSPQVLLLDEATSHIDSDTEIAVQTAVNGLKGHVTVIAIAHRLSTIRDADQIAVLNHGHLAELGPHEDLMARDRGIYRRLYELQRLEMEGVSEASATDASKAG